MFGQTGQPLDGDADHDLLLPGNQEKSAAYAVPVLLGLKHSVGLPGNHTAPPVNTRRLGSTRASPAPCVWPQSTIICRSGRDAIASASTSPAALQVKCGNHSSSDIRPSCQHASRNGGMRQHQDVPEAIQGVSSTARKRAAASSPRICNTSSLSRSGSPANSPISPQSLRITRRVAPGDRHPSRHGRCRGRCPVVSGTTPDRGSQWRFGDSMASVNLFLHAGDGAVVKVMWRTGRRACPGCRSASRWSPRRSPATRQPSLRQRDLHQKPVATHGVASCLPAALSPAATAGAGPYTNWLSLRCKIMVT